MVEMRTDPAIIALSLSLAMAVPVRGEESPSTSQTVRRPRDSWTLQLGLSHSSSDLDHYAVSGFHAWFPLYSLDRDTKSDAQDVYRSKDLVSQRIPDDMLKEKPHLFLPYSPPVAAASRELCSVCRNPSSVIFRPSGPVT